MEGPVLQVVQPVPLHFTGWLWDLVRRFEGRHGLLLALFQEACSVHGLILQALCSAVSHPDPGLESALSHLHRPALVLTVDLAGHCRPRCPGTSGRVVQPGSQLPRGREPAKSADSGQGPALQPASRVALQGCSCPTHGAGRGGEQMPRASSDSSSGAQRALVSLCPCVPHPAAYTVPSGCHITVGSSGRFRVLKHR